MPQDALTDGSENVKVSNRGALVKREGGAEFTASTLPVGTTASTVKDMYEAIFTDGTRFLLTMANGQLDYSTGGGDFKKAQSGYTAAGNMEFASYRDRVYFSNAAENPQVLDRTTGYGSVLSTPCTITIVTAANLAGIQSLLGQQPRPRVLTGPRRMEITTPRLQAWLLPLAPFLVSRPPLLVPLSRSLLLPR